MGLKSKRCDLVIKSVCFNKLNSHEVKLLEHLSNVTNISGYVKRLIDKDMHFEISVPTPTESAELVQVEAHSEDDLLGGWMG